MGLQATGVVMGNAADKAIERLGEVPVSVQAGVVLPGNLDEQLRVAKWAHASGLVPTTTVASTWMVMQRGAELGFSALGSFDYLYVVNSRVRITPDGMKAKAQASGLIQDAKEEVFGADKEMVARVTIKRRGIPTPIVGEFSAHDAVLARLWGKRGPKGDSAWVTHPKRMLLARARGFAYQDAFRDLAGGLQVREMDDLEPGEALGDGDAPVVEAARKPPAGGDPLLAGVGSESCGSTAERPDPVNAGRFPGEGDAGSTPAGATPDEPPWDPAPTDDPAAVPDSALEQPPSEFAKGRRKKTRKAQSRQRRLL